MSKSRPAFVTTYFQEGKPIVGLHRSMDSVHVLLDGLVEYTVEEINLTDEEWWGFPITVLKD